MSMDINDIRSAVTVLGFVLFIALVRWVWAARRRDAFDAAAQLPFNDEEQRHE
jgi:cytochrome c oxidase cbb3-type subunit IV